MDLGLTDKIAVVGASSKGLGRAIALGLAHEGAKVTICARRQSRSGSDSGRHSRPDRHRVLAVPTDVSQPDQVENLIRAAIGHFGGIDILVNNAGGPRAGRFDDLGAQDYQDAVQLNLMSTINLCRAVVRRCGHAGVDGSSTLPLSRSNNPSMD